MKKILVVGPAWVGDAVMAQSLLKTLKQQEGQVLIDVLAPAWSHPVLKSMPEVHEALKLPFQHGELALKARYRLALTLRERSYDQAIVLPNSFKSALIPFWAKIPLRTGWLGEMRWLLLNDIRINPKKIPLMISRFNALAHKKGEASEKFFYPSLVTQPEAVQKTLNQFDLALNQPVLALCPGAEFGSSKRWLSSYYAAVAQAQLNEGWQVWLLGSSKDKIVTDEIEALIQGNVKNLAGRTQLGEVINLLSVVEKVVTNDSGLMHIAAALERPIVVIYGSSSPSFTPPLSSRAMILSANVECQPCFKRECPLMDHQFMQCMHKLSPQIVLKAIQKISA